MKDRYAYRDVPVFDSCDCWRGKPSVDQHMQVGPRNPETCGLARLSDKLIGRFSPHGLTLGFSKAGEGRVHFKWLSRMSRRLRGVSFLCVCAGTCLVCSVSRRERGQ
ncbi:hypothetical protein V8C26DRAFT_400185 [Trichoderma gracile]